MTYPDIINSICKYLHPIDKMSLSQVCKSYRYINPNFQTLLQEYLQKHLPTDALSINNCFFGSILLQILYDEDWESSIDIYEDYVASSTCEDDDSLYSKPELISSD